MTEAKRVSGAERVSGSLLRAEGLGRWYGEVVGLSEVDLALEPGLYGLVGPNGAGKSTFLGLIAGELRPSRGRVTVLGEEPFANTAHFRRVGYCPQQDALYRDLTGLQFVSFLMRLHGFGRREARRRAEAALERVGLADARRRRTKGYSKGMRQRCKLAAAIAHGPELLIADEPLNGLDPIGRAEMGELFAELGRAGTSLVVSSHVLHEVESLTERMLLLSRGRLVADGTVGEIRALLSRHPRRVTVRARDPRRLARALVDLEHVTSLRVDAAGGRLELETADLDALLDDLGRVVPAAAAGILSMESQDASLEAVFEYLVA